MTAIISYYRNTTLNILDVVRPLAAVKSPLNVATLPASSVTQLVMLQHEGRARRYLTLTDSQPLLFFYYE